MPTDKIQSGVMLCHECDGDGEVWNGRGAGGNDPDSFGITCEVCEGEGHFPCEVCGFDQVIEGYDCLPCEVAGALTFADLRNLDVARFVEAFKLARVAVLDSEERVGEAA